MPGMNINGAQVNQRVFLKKYRWLFDFAPVGGRYSDAASTGRFAPASLVYVASRPRWTQRDEIINHQTEQITIPTRATWEPIDISFLHEAGDSAAWQWLLRCHDIMGSGSHIKGRWGFYEEILVDAWITMTNGCGVTQEQWKLEQCWPLNIDWGDLDRASSDIAELKVQLKYARAYCTYADKTESKASS